MKRRHVLMKTSSYCKIMGVGQDAGYADIRKGAAEGGIDSVKVGKRKQRIPVVAVEEKVRVNPGDLDELLDVLEG